MSVKTTCFLPTSDGQVVKITKDVVGDYNKRRLFMDTKAMEKIFGKKEVSNSPVAIYCIAGMLRRGKSFFLNLVLRYLEFKVGHKTGSWLDDKTANVNKGFEWKVGSEAHTKGILIWSEPFWLDTPQYGKVAVFLMDTQGIGDKTSSPETDANLFSLSTLLSSYHIYSMKDVMNNKDLDQLKNFTEFGKKMKNKYEDSLNQTLLFLMRDWQDPKFELGFKGGREYLEKTFTDVSVTSEHYKELCDNIKTSFKEVKCALLPHPGKKFVFMERETTMLKDIDDDFLKEVELLLHDMFENISVKHLGDKTLKGKDVIDQAIRFSQHTKTSVDADMLLAITSQSFLANLIGRCEDKFVGEIKRLRDSYRSDIELHKFHFNLVEEVLNYYKAKINLWPSEEVNSQRTLVNSQRTLRESLNERFFMLKNANDFPKQGVRELYRALVNDALVNFKDTLSVEFDTKKVKSFVEINTFDEKMKVNEILATQWFEGTVSKNVMSSEIFSQYQEKLKATINLQEKLYKSKNDFLMIRVQKELLKASIRAIDSFKQGFKKGRRQDEEVELDSWFQKIIENSLALYKSSKVDKRLELYKNGETKLKETLTRLAGIYKSGIDMEEKGKSSIVTSMLATMKIYFQDKIPMGSMNDISESDSDQKYKEVRDEIFSLIPNMLKDEQQQMVASLCDELQAENEVEHHLLKDEFLLELVGIKKICAKTIHEFLNAEKGLLLQKLDIEKEKLMKMFRNATNGKEGKWRDLATKTEEDLNALFDHASSTSQVQIAIDKLHDQEIVEKFHTIMILRYTEQMAKMLKMTKAKDEKLKEIHDKIIRDYSQNMENKFGRNPITQIAFNTFQDIALGQYVKWCNVNSFHVTVYPREMSRWAEIWLKVKKICQELRDGDVANMRIINLPTDWVLSPRFGEHPAKLNHLKLMEKKESSNKAKIRH